MITFDAANISSTENDSISIPHACAGENRLLLVAVSFAPNADQAVTAITYGGVALAKVSEARVRDAIHSEVWCLATPEIGTADVVVTLSASAKVVCGVASFCGVSQLYPVYFFTNGVGDNISSIACECQRQIGDMVFASVALLDDAEFLLAEGQVLAFRGSYTGLTAQGIYGLPQTESKYLGGVLSKISSCVFNILGIKAA